MNGHLSAGGGFQGGAVIASSVLLVLLAYPQYQPNLEFLGITESVAGALFVLAGIAGLIVAGGFLDNRILPLGQFGAFFSAGAIPVANVGSAARSGLYESFKTVFSTLTPPWAIAFWGRLTAAITLSAERIWMLYTCNGQTYNLYILYYFLVLYVAGGIHHL